MRRYCRLKFRDLRTLTSFSRSRSRTPFRHFCTFPVEDYQHTHTHISLPAPWADFVTHIRTLTPHPITAKAIYSSPSNNSKHQKYSLCLKSVNWSHINFLSSYIFTLYIPLTFQVKRRIIFLIPPPVWWREPWDKSTNQKLGPDTAGYRSRSPASCERSTTVRRRDGNNNNTCYLVFFI